MADYRTAFPDYDNGPAAQTLIAAGFADQSWKNDICPSFVRGRVAIFADYLAPELREVSDAPGYTAILINADDSYNEESVSFDTVEAAIQFAHEVQRRLDAGDGVAEAALPFAPEVIEGCGQFRAGSGPIATGWHDTRDTALVEFQRLARAFIYRPQ